MTGPSHQTTGRSDPFDELAAMFLTDVEEASEAQAVKEPAFRELLVVGNLPVRGGVWLTPYADAIARVNGPTALARFDLEPPTLERLGFAQRDEVAESPQTFQGAVLRAVNEAAVWIVRAPTGARPAELVAHRVDRITILTSADNAAVVAAYRIIKDLASAAGEIEADLPAIALAVAGADEDDAAEAVKRINETCTSNLGINVSLACSLPRLDAGVRCESFASFTDEETPTVEDLLAWIDSALDDEHWRTALDEAEQRCEAEDEDDERPVLRLAPTIVEDDREREALLSDEDQPPLVRLSPHEVKSIHREPPPAANGAVRLAPKPAASSASATIDEPRPTPNNIDEDHSLARHLPGLTPLPVRCPAHEEIELAADDAGRIHLLAREGLLREMRIVENWARTHRRILSLACGKCTIDVDAEICSHVFTDEPAQLADLHGTGLALYVLAPVKIADQTAWYCAPLSR